MAGRSLDLALTAVDEEFTTGDVTTFIGGEEGDRFGDLIRGSRSAQRNGRSDGLSVVVLLLFRHPKACVVARRRNDARTDRVDADAPALQVHSPIAGKRAYRRFGGTIDAKGRASLNGNQRGVQDNRAARGHQRQCALNREERALDVDIELLVEVFLLNLSQRSELTDAGIGEEDVEFALLLADSLMAAARRSASSLQLRGRYNCAAMGAATQPSLTTSSTLTWQLADFPTAPQY
jgi:hypothetical protein